ncbi:uncharacterized protein LY89DRAFT_222371 [Mollisia scopiformis]|uniref:Uncharacterized protein n=1 Tax=Mollisia scopiformis TaxID=149040 RepID=A0A194WWQ1_MOLSC|nr:uncharacterized protein LY89DRAFT_222371 [Mollisia scopiformis]KUJ12114.1 hypothetical protein LY89DRAFT_222371 [Mollisia scopiformis]
MISSREIARADRPSARFVEAIKTSHACTNSYASVLVQMQLPAIREGAFCHPNPRLPTIMELFWRLELVLPPSGRGSSNPVPDMPLGVHWRDARLFRSPPTGVQARLPSTSLQPRKALQRWQITAGGVWSFTQNVPDNPGFNFLNWRMSLLRRTDIREFRACGQRRRGVKKFGRRRG